MNEQAKAFDDRILSVQDRGQDGINTYVAYTLKGDADPTRDEYNEFARSQGYFGGHIHRTELKDGNRIVVLALYRD